VKVFCMATKLTDIGGRADYITSERRQEDIVAVSPTVDWKPYQDFEKANQKSKEPNNQGREITIALPNEWAELDKSELESRAKSLAEKAVGKSTDLQWAVHWNKTKNNLHMHVIFSERTKTQSAGKYTQDVYLAADGRVARYKADRARDADGNIKPPVHRKGDDKGSFTAKDTRYKAHSRQFEVMEAVEKEFKRFGVVIEPPELVAQYHEGKGGAASRIQAVNKAIRESNENYKKYVARIFPKKLSEDEIKKAKSKIIKSAQKGIAVSFAPPPPVNVTNCIKVIEKAIQENRKDKQYHLGNAVKDVLKSCRIDDIRLTIAYLAVNKEKIDQESLEWANEYLDKRGASEVSIDDVQIVTKNNVLNAFIKNMCEMQFKLKSTYEEHKAFSAERMKRSEEEKKGKEVQPINRNKSKGYCDDERC